MPAKAYIGDENGIAQAVSKLYIGDENGIAQRVVKAYIGDENGIAQLCYSGDVEVVLDFVSLYGQIAINGSTYEDDATIKVPIGTKVEVTFNKNGCVAKVNSTFVSEIKKFYYIVTGDVKIKAETNSVTFEESGAQSGCFALTTDYPNGAYYYYGFSYRNGMEWGTFVDSMYNYSVENNGKFNVYASSSHLYFGGSTARSLYRTRNYDEDNLNEVFAATVKTTEKIINGHTYYAVK